MNTKELKKLAHRTAGFTLIELLLVITILAALAAMVSVGFAGKGEEAKITTTRQSLGSIKTAAIAYEIQKGSFPNSLDDLTVETDTEAALLNKDTLNDNWGTPFQYKKLSKFKFEVRSAGPDMQFNTEDDITDTN